ncbi:hypothetical protein KSF_032290 [Reticulibacter mediterranei]|uniref:Uncharacterized protein n=1 Tax=Reticulibacter mediterranei TaxID=2778369 RepID=A0A8J3IMW7_9CHLR|nr:DUF3226 domain-containing protein [Reticulibacter mediterranei]GHO93181.1 hypothetical protein KSF_032290 [Reticulibacter mediterranei]
MSLKYCLLATEGPHDQAAIAKLLQLSGLTKFDGNGANLDPFWGGFVPTYPKKGKLYVRLDMPSILTSATHSIAVYWGEGSELIKNLIAITTNHMRYAREIYSFGLIVDADNRQPDAVAKKKAKELRTIFPSLSEMPGSITNGPPRTGIYVLPDNKRQGSLDSMLNECASIVYLDHKKGALQFINDLDEIHTKDLIFTKKDKALVACITSILQPGAANTSSIAQDDWISEKTIYQKDVVLLYRFLSDLLELDRKIDA